MAMGKCPKCGSYDVDIAADHKYTFECQECGRRWNLPKPRATAPRVGQIVTSGSGADTFMGTVLEVRGKTREALVKYVDFTVPRLVRFNEIRSVGR